MIITVTVIMMVAMMVITMMTTMMTTMMMTAMIMRMMRFTPEEDPMPEDPNPPWEPKVSRPWSLLASPQMVARAPLRESIEGVGDVISPDFCLTWDQVEIIGGLIE